MLNSVSLRYVRIPAVPQIPTLSELVPTLQNAGEIRTLATPPGVSKSELESTQRSVNEIGADRIQRRGAGRIGAAKLNSH